MTRPAAGGRNVEETAANAAAPPDFAISGQRFAAPPLVPGLYVTATPIGNLDDISLRALKTLAAADLILCEDTRVTAKLRARYDIETPMRPYHDHNGARARPGILKALGAGGKIALVSDAGTPLISDPGLKLVREAIAGGHHVTAIPGPSAALAGLVLSGLGSDQFHFAGFLPAKAGARAEKLRSLAHVPGSLIFYESAGRLEAALSDIIEHLGERPLALARELTKLHEEMWRGTPGELALALKSGKTLKGEIVLVIGAGEEAVHGEDEVEALLATALATLSVRDAADLVAAQAKRPRREVYKLALALAART